MHGAFYTQHQLILEYSWKIMYFYDCNLIGSRYHQDSPYPIADIILQNLPILLFLKKKLRLRVNDHILTREKKSKGYIIC